MADKALENAIAQRDEVAKRINTAQQQIDEWKRELARADAFIRDWHVFAGTEPVTGVGQAVVAATGTAVRTGPRNSKKEEVAAVARELIGERGAPIGRRELYERLIGRGLTIRGADPEMVLSTMLWRMSGPAKIVRLKSGGYWLADRSYPDAHYYADDSNPDWHDLIGVADNEPPDASAESEDEEPGD